MVKSFIFNMGYDTSHVTSVLAKEGLEDGSTICLIKPGKSDSRQRNAISDIENHLSSLDIETYLKTYSSGKSIISDIGQFLKLFDNREDLVLSLSGGSRDLLIPLTIASTISQNSIDKIYFRSDIDSELKEVKLPKLHLNLSEAEKKFLSTVKSQPSDAYELCSKLNLSKSTIYRKKTELERKEMIEIRKKNGREKFYITELGKAIESLKIKTR